MKRRVIVRRSSLNRKHNAIVVTRRVLSILLVFASVYFVLEALLNALSNQIGALTQDGHPVDDPVARFIIIALVLVICGAIAYPYDQKLKGIGKNRRKKTTTIQSVLL